MKKLLLLFLLSSCKPAETPDAISLNPDHSFLLNISSKTEQHPPDSIAIKTGTSYGECTGYCLTEFSLHQWGIEKVNSAWPPGSDTAAYPKQYIILPMRKTAYDSLLAAVDLTVFANLPERIGCPDCNDGGAEWIKIETGCFKKRVLFEVGHDIPEIQKLQERIRKLTGR